MSVATIAPVESTIHTTNVWLKELMEELGWDDRYHAYRALAVVLHALRDRLPVAEAADLGAQLPTLIRGFYYEGWTPAGKPVKARKREDFLAQITEAFPGNPDVSRKRLPGLSSRSSNGVSRRVRSATSCMPCRRRFARSGPPRKPPPPGDKSRAATAGRSTVSQGASGPWYLWVALAMPVRASGEPTEPLGEASATQGMSDRVKASCRAPTARGASKSHRNCFCGQPSQQSPSPLHPHVLLH